MADLREIVVTDKTGATGRILGELEEADERMVVVEFAGASYQLPRDVLVAQGEDSFLLPLSVAELALARQVIPVVREEIEVGKRAVTERVRIHTEVRERPQEVEVELEDIEVSVERVPIGRLLDGNAEMRSEGDTTIIPVLEERVVVTKQLFLKEEVRVTRKRTTRTHRDTVTLREEEVKIDRAPAQTPQEGGDGYVSSSEE